MTRTRTRAVGRCLDALGVGPARGPAHTRRANHGTPVVQPLACPMATAEPHALFRHAAAFEHASVRLAPTAEEPAEALAPYVVNSVFALELYLKCLLVLVKGKYPQVHSVQALFFDLPDDEILRVRKLHRQIFRAHAAGAGNGASRGGGSGRRGTRDRVDDLDLRADHLFDDILAGAKDAFTVARYRYEDAAGAPDGIPDVGVIIASVRGRLLTLRPEWRQGR